MNDSQTEWSWADNLRDWRRLTKKSKILAFLFLLTETFESALPLRVPVLSLILFWALWVPYTLRARRRARSAAV
jgi:hypothetical protein